MLYSSYSIPVSVLRRLQNVAESQDIHVRVVEGFAGRNRTTHLYLKGRLVPLTSAGVVDLSTGKIEAAKAGVFECPEGSETSDCRIVGHWFGVHPQFGAPAFPPDVLTLIWNQRDGVLHSEFAFAEDDLETAKKVLENAGPVALEEGNTDRYFGQVRYAVSLFGTGNSRAVSNGPVLSSQITLVKKGEAPVASKTDDFADLR